MSRTQSVFRNIAILAAALLWAASAAAFTSPDALIAAIYDPLLAGNNEPPADDLYCADTLKKLKAVEAEEDTGLGFSPFVDGQDYDLNAFKVKPGTASNDRATLTVSFENIGTPKQLQYDLAKEGAGWCVHNITSLDANEGWSLQDMLAP